MARTFADFAVSVGSLATGLPKDMAAATGRAALALTTAARASIAAGSGGDSILSGVKSAKSKGRRSKDGTITAGKVSKVKTAKVGAGYELTPAAGGKAATAIVHARGPLHLLDNPTKAHEIAPLPGKGRSMKSRAGMEQRGAYYAALFGYAGAFSGIAPMPVAAGVFRYRAQSPGTKGKRTFWKAIDRTAPRVAGIYQAELAKAMGRRFK